MKETIKFRAIVRIHTDSCVCLTCDFKTVCNCAEYSQQLPSLLHIKESDRLSILEEEVACPSVEDAVTRRTLYLLGHLVTKVFDDQLCVCVCARACVCVCVMCVLITKLDNH